jgi:hypothetical protein
MPDVGLPLVLATMTFIMLRPALRTSVRARGSTTTDNALHAGVPTA